MKFLHPQRKTRQQQRRWKKKTIILLTTGIIILGSFFYVMNHPYMQVNDISVVGERAFVENDIKSSIEIYLQERYLGLIPKGNIILLSPTAIIKMIDENYPKIQNTHVELVEGDILEIIIGERQAHSLWCVDREYESVFEEECYFSDEHGLLYTRAPYFSGHVYLKMYLAPNTDNPMGVGTYVRDSMEFAELFKFLENIEQEYSLRIYRVYFDLHDDVRIELTRLQSQIYSQNHPYIIYNDSADYNTLFRNIGITFNYETFVRDFAAKPARFKSVDVRFGNRVFYTFTPIS